MLEELQLLVLFPEFKKGMLTVRKYFLYSITVKHLLNLRERESVVVFTTCVHVMLSTCSCVVVHCTSKKPTLLLVKMIDV